MTGGSRPISVGCEAATVLGSVGTELSDILGELTRVGRIPAECVPPGTTPTDVRDDGGGTGSTSGPVAGREGKECVSSPISVGVEW